MIREIKVTEEHIGRRLDRVLKLFYPDTSKVLLFKLLRQKKILVNKLKSTPNYLLKPNDIIQIKAINALTTEVKSTVVSKKILKQELHVIYEDEDIVVFDKPHGLAVQGGTGVDIAMVDIINHRYEQKIYPVHRLDKETSGCILFAKNYTSARLISEDFKHQRVKKVYFAAIKGEWIHGACMINHLDPKYKYHPLVNLFEGKEATTEVLSVDCINKVSLLKLKPFAGRKHQIRIHLAITGYPILGDSKYGDFLLNRKLKRLYLHADELSFMHPKEHKQISINSKYTEIFKKDIKALDNII